MIYLGIDFGATTIKIGFFDENINCIKKEIIKSKNINIKEMIKLIQLFCIKEKVKAIGIGIAGFVLKNGKIHSTTNLFPEYQELINLLEKEICSNISILNDADAALKAELMVHKNIKGQNACLITLGTGVGGAISISGEILSGTRGLAGEIGHIKIRDSYNFKCGCLRTDCLETIASTQGFMNLYHYYKDLYPNSILNSYNYVNTNIIFENSNDKLARLIINKVAYYIAQVCIQVGLMCDINLFIIGGGISNLMENEVADIKKFFMSDCHYLQQDSQFILAHFRNDAGMIGAALYAKEEIKK